VLQYLNDPDPIAVQAWNSILDAEKQWKTGYISQCDADKLCKIVTNVDNYSELTDDIPRKLKLTRTLSYLYRYSCMFISSE
jgi:hypothetical protein